MEVNREGNRVITVTPHQHRANTAAVGNNIKAKEATGKVKVKVNMADRSNNSLAGTDRRLVLAGTVDQTMVLPQADMDNRLDMEAQRKVTMADRTITTTISTTNMAADTRAAIKAM